MNSMKMRPAKWRKTAEDAWEFNDGREVTGRITYSDRSGLYTAWGNGGHAGEHRRLRDAMRASPEEYCSACGAELCGTQGAHKCQMAVAS